MIDRTSRNAFLIHLAAYVGVNAGLIALNATQAVPAGEPRDWWAIWPLAGWGIGVLAHGFALWIETRAHGNSLLADEDARGVAVHLFVYLTVNAFLIVLNVKTSPDTFWSIWPILGWGLGLAAHAWLAYRKILRKTVERYANEQRILAQMQLEQQAADIAAVVAEPDDKPKPKRKRAARKKQTAKKAPTKTRKTAAKKKPARKKPAAKKPARRAASKKA